VLSAQSSKLKAQGSKLMPTRITMSAVESSQHVHAIHQIRLCQNTPDQVRCKDDLEVLEKKLNKFFISSHY
jgi:hypothetical protein